MEKTLESLLDSKEIKPVNLKYSMEGLIPKLQYFGHLMRRANSWEKSLTLRKIRAKEGRRRKDIRG